MSCRIAAAVLCLLVLELLSAPLRAQTVLHYSFKPGEHLRYHYSFTGTRDRMRTKGRKEVESQFEADPDWIVHDVDMDGAATVLLTVANRTENYKEGHWRMNFVHMTPQSEIAVSPKGKLLFGKIKVDDAERKRSKKEKNRFDIHLESDKQVLTGYFRHLWYQIRDEAFDTTGIPDAQPFDTTYNRTFEKDTTLFGRLGHFKTKETDLVHDTGTSIRSLHDTLVDGEHYWALTISTNGKAYASENFINDYRRSDNALFRKSDGIIQRWEHQMVDHNGVEVFTSDEVLDLKKIEGY